MRDRLSEDTHRGGGYCPVHRDSWRRRGGEGREEERRGGEEEKRGKRRGVEGRGEASLSPPFFSIKRRCD